MALRYSDIRVELREVALGNKPAAMLQASPKGTVPVLVDTDGAVIDESLDIIYWSLKQNDPHHWLQNPHQTKINTLIQQNDGQFKIDLDHYKYSDRFPENSQCFYRQQGERFLIQLEQRLSHQSFLISNTVSLADVALLPFIRQFALVDIQWFESSPYPALRRWLTHWLESELFLSVMLKQAFWPENHQQHAAPVIL